MKKSDLGKVSESSGGEALPPGVPEVSWQQHLVADVKRYGADAVVQAVVDTHGWVKERKLTAQQTATLKWHGYAWWALPDPLFIAADMLRMRDNLYHRAWLCELDGTVIDGHQYVNQGSGCCQVCGL